MSEQTPGVPGPGQPEGQAQPPKFDPAAPHQQRPRLRPIRGFAMQQEGRQILGLADAQQISDRVVYTAPVATVILPHLTGQNDLDAVVQKVNAQVREQASKTGQQAPPPLDRSQLEQFVAQLDAAALLEGPTFEAVLEKMRKDFDSSETLPPSATANLADALAVQELGEEATDAQKNELGPTKLRETMDKWIAEALKEAKDPSFDRLPRGVIAPHLDYARGWMNYAHTYGRMRVVDRPDRVIVLGTNHFGRGTGVVGCDKGYETPLGVSPLASDAFEALKKHLGPDNSEKLLAERYDHEREHSIELQVGWIQHVFAPPADQPEGGHVPVMGVLVHDPARNAGKSYDEKGLDFEPFVEALRKTIAELPGKTLLVSSADLSHVGPQFGDRAPLAGDQATNPQGIAARNAAIQQDQQLVNLVKQGKPDDLIASMAWQNNPTRWCSTGNLCALLKALDAREEDITILNYAGAMDQQGMALVTSISAAIF